MMAVTVYLVKATLYYLEYGKEQYDWLHQEPIINEKALAQRKSI